MARGCLQQEVGLGQGRGGETEVSRNPASQAPGAHLPPLTCLSTGLRGTDAGREKAQGKRSSFPFAAGWSGEALVLATHSFPWRGRAPALRGGSGVQRGKGQLSCWLEPVEIEMTLRHQHHCSGPPGPLQEPVQGTCTHTPCHLPVLRAPHGAQGLHEVESIGMA